MKNWFNEKYYLLLVTITLGLLVWHQVGMVSTVSLSTDALKQATLLNDDINGGISQGELSYANESLTLRCKTAHSLSFPFCSAMIPLTSGSNLGLDLSDYESIRFTLTYKEKDNLRDTVLVYLLNTEHRVGEGSFSDLRANLSTISPPSEQSMDYALLLDQFHVPSWWYLSRSRDVSTSRNLDQVQYLQISTGDSRELKNTEISIGKVSFYGKWISNEILYSFLFFIWILSVILHSARLFLAMIRKVQDKDVQLETLQGEKEAYAFQAKNDALTGVLNRYGFNDVYEQQRENNTTDCLILFDIDDFKKINDIHGHDVGDKVLVQLSKIVSVMLRERDELARWGGEEFVILCSGTNIDGAISLAYRIRSKIESLRISKRISISCSFGVAPIVTTLESGFKQADKALYRAKERGKNRVEYIELVEYASVEEVG